MRFSFRVAVSGALAVAMLAACMSITAVPILDDEDDEDDGGAAPDAATPIDAPEARDSGDAAPPFVARSVWFPTSTRVEYVVSDAPAVHHEYRKDRAELSAEQLAALEQVRTHDGGGPPIEDNVTYTLRIRDVDGGVASYRASAGAEVNDTIQISTLERFIATVPCLHPLNWRAHRRDAGPGADASLPVFPTDLGCTNTLRFQSVCEDAYATIEVPDAASYELTVSASDFGGCVAPMGARIYTSDRSTVLAESVPGDAGDAGHAGATCAKLRLPSAPGRYVLSITKDNVGSSCDPEPAPYYVHASITLEKLP